jgi:maleylpyruvate isomerase
MAELPRYRWRETEVHHRDLGLAFDATDWDPAFVATELGIWMPGLADRLPDGTALEVTATDTGQTWTAGDGSAGFTSVEAPAAGLLAWLTGRGDDTLPRLSAWSW